jgi:hypothetical protein
MAGPGDITVGMPVYRPKNGSRAVAIGESYIAKDDGTWCAKKLVTPVFYMLDGRPFVSRWLTQNLARDREPVEDLWPRYVAAQLRGELIPDIMVR